MSVTCFGVDREEILWVASSDTITETTRRSSEVRVLRLDTDDWNILWRILHDGWVVDRIRGEGSIVIDILNLRKTEGKTDRNREWALLTFIVFSIRDGFELAVVLIKHDW